jgi:hypothetical protein
LAHHGDRQINIRRSAQHAGQQIDLFKGRRIAPICGFIIRRAVDIVENRLWQAALGQCAKIVKVVAIGQAHGILVGIFCATLCPKSRANEIRYRNAACFCTHCAASALRN